MVNQTVAFAGRDKRLYASESALMYFFKCYVLIVQCHIVHCRKKPTATVLYHKLGEMYSKL